MKPIRVLQVLTIMNRGGAETMIMNYYRNIDRTKIQFDFLLHREYKGAYDDEIKNLGGIIYRMPPIWPKNYYRYKKALSAFFKEHPEYRIVHSHLNALSAITLEVAKKNGVPIRIAHSHLAIEPFVFKSLFSKNNDALATLKATIHSLMRSRVGNKATHYFACGEKAGRWLFGTNSEKKVRIINNAIDAARFKYDQKKSKEIKQSLGISGKKVIGHVGRFNEQKNHHFLIQIFNEIVTLDNNVVLLLVGDGNMRAKIEEEIKRLKIEKYVHFLGIRDDIPILLQSFDLFLFPSLYEGLPVTLVEAQASGLKIITSDTVTKEIDFMDLVTFVSLKRSAKDWARIILEQITYDRKNRFQRIVDSNYDINQNAADLQNFYLNLSKKCAVSTDS